MRHTIRKQTKLASEADLVDLLIRRIPPWLGSQRRRVKVTREVAVGGSIADVVVLVGAPAKPVIHDPLSTEESVVLAWLRRRGPTRIDILEQRCGFGPQRLRNGALSRLKESGVVALGQGGRVATGRPLGGRSRLLAIEAKLAKWRPALQQACAYLKYADKAYVALPYTATVRGRVPLEAFKESGVGLISVSERGLREIVAAKKSSDHDWRREYVVSRVIGMPEICP